MGSSRKPTRRVVRLPDGRRLIFYVFEA